MLVSQKIVHKVHNQRVYSQATTWGESDLPLFFLLQTSTDTQDYQKSIRLAKLAGMVSMSINLPDPNTFFNVTTACAAAAIEGSFTIAPCLDMAGVTGTLTASAMATAIAPYLGYAQLDVTDTGLIVLWTNAGTSKSASYWQDFLTALSGLGHDAALMLDITPLAAAVRSGTMTLAQAETAAAVYRATLDDGVNVGLYNFSPDVKPYVDQINSTIPSDKRTYTVWPGYYRRIPVVIFIDYNGTQVLSDYITAADSDQPLHFTSDDDWNECDCLQPSIKRGDVYTQIMAGNITDDWVTYPMEVKPGTVFNVEHLTGGLGGVPVRNVQSFTAPGAGSVAFIVNAFGYTLDIGINASPAKTLLSRKSTDLVGPFPGYTGSTVSFNFEAGLIGGSITIWAGDTCVLNHKITQQAMSFNVATAVNYRAIAVHPITGLSDSTMPQRTFFSLFFSILTGPHKPK